MINKDVDRLVQPVIENSSRELSASTKERFQLSIGIEGTFAPQSGKDILAITGHYENEQWQQDFALIAQLGIQQFRYSIP